MLKAFFLYNRFAITLNLFLQKAIQYERIIFAFINSKKSIIIGTIKGQWFQL